MYLAGYSIECKLKARLMEMYNLQTLEQLEQELERRAGRSINVFTHSIEILFGLTGVRERLLAEPKTKSVLHAYQRCNRWKPAWRYNADDASQEECVTFLDAIEEFGRFIDNNI
jgi:hypothetical protein